MKTKIAIVGSGNIGWALKQLLKEDYEIKQGDITDGFDATDVSQVKEFLTGVDAVISAGSCRYHSIYSCKKFFNLRNISCIKSVSNISLFNFIIFF